MELRPLMIYLNLIRCEGRQINTLPREGKLEFTENHEYYASQFRVISAESPSLLSRYLRIVLYCDLMLVRFLRMSVNAR